MGFGISSKSRVLLFQYYGHSNGWRVELATLLNWRLALSVMKWPVLTAVIIGCFCFKAAMHSRFLRSTRCFLYQTIYRTKDYHWSEQTLSNGEIITWSEETLNMLDILVGDSSDARLSTLQLNTSHSQLEQWKASRHRLLWVAVVNRNVGKWNAPGNSIGSHGIPEFKSIGQVSDCLKRDALKFSQQKWI